MASDDILNDDPAAFDSAMADSGAMPTARVPGTRRWRINRRLGLATLAVLLILAPSAFGWHAFQFRRNAAAILTRAAALNDQKDWQGAASCVHRYLQLRPGDPQALLLAAQCRDKSAFAPEERQRAVSMYIQAVRVNPGDTPARKRLAELLLETGRLDEAAQQAQQVVAELPDDVESVRILARVVREQLGQSRKTSAADVVELYRTALTKHPGDVVLSTGLADVLRKFHDSLPAELGDTSATAADEVIDDMVARRPSDAEALLARYRYRSAWQVPGAGEDLEQARLAAPDDPDVLLACVAATRNGDSAAAREVAERLLEVAPHNRRACFAVAACYSRLNQWDEALRVLEEAAERLGRDDLELNRALLQIYLSQQESERAEAVLAHLEPLFHRLEPQLAPPLRRRFAEELEFARAQLLCLAGKPAAALPALKRLAANVTESADAAENVAERQRRWKLLAAVYSHLGMHDRAANAFDSLVRLDPRSRENQLLAAAEWQRIGDFERASRHFESAATGDSELPAAWLGMAETRLRQQLQKSPASSRDWSGYDAALKQLESRHGDLPAVVILKASAALARNDRAGALRDLKKLASQPRLESAHLPRIAILFQDAGAPADADAALERFHRSGANAEYAALAESELQRRRGDFDAALQTLEQAVDRAPESGRGALLRQLVGAEIDSGAIQSARRRLKGLRQSKFPDLWAYETAADLAVVAGDAADLLDCAQQIESLDGADGTLWRFVKSIQLLESEKEGNDAVHQANRWAAEIETSRPTWAQLQTLRGRIADRLGRTAEAAESYEQALRSGARSLATCQWLVSALQRLNRSADAANFVGQSNQIAALSDELSAEAIPASLRTGHIDAALRIARTAAELRPADTAAQVWYSQTLALTGKADQAESLLRKVLERAPQDTRAWSALVWVLHRANRTAEARQTLQQLVGAVTLDPHERALVLARGCDLLGDDRAAEQNYRQSLVGHEKNSRLLEEVGRFYLRIDHDQSLAAFQQALAVNPRSVEARRTVAWLLGIRGTDAEWGRALVALNQLDSSTIPDDHRLQATILLVHGGAKNLQKAANLLVDLVGRNDQAQPADRLLLARAYEQLHRLTDARRQFDAALKSNNSPAFRAQYAQFLVRQKLYDEALVLTFEKADGADPVRDALAVIRVLTAVASQGAVQPARGATAEKFAADIGASQPGNVPLLLELGVLRLMQGRAPDALKLFESAQQRSPANPAVLNNLALARLEFPNRRHEALATIDKALALAPQSAELLDSKALILIGAGRHQEAREILDQLCRAQTRNPRLRLHLAIALFQLRDEPGSRSNAAQATDDGLEKELLTPSERHLWRQITSQVAGVTSK